jgi:hypothetical protein
MESGKESKKQNLDLPTTGIKFRSRKRVYQQQTSRVTRSEKFVAQSEASLTPSGIHVPSLVQSDASLRPRAIYSDFQGYFYYHFSYLYSISFDNMIHTLI